MLAMFHNHEFIRKEAQRTPVVRIKEPYDHSTDTCRGRSDVCNYTSPCFGFRCIRYYVNSDGKKPGGAGHAAPWHRSRVVLEVHHALILYDCMNLLA